MKGWTFGDFLRWKGNAISAEDRALVSGFVEGFEAAPLEQMSANAMEGQTLDDEEQARCPRGYDQVVAALEREARRAGVRIELGAVVRGVKWRRGSVEVQTQRGAFMARAAVVTLPLGVLQLPPRTRGAVAFDPRLRAKEKVAARMGMGHVTRLTLRFDRHAWRSLLPDPLRGAAKRGFGFIHSRLRGVPVWWALSGEPVVTGWVGGPAALALERKSPAAIRQTALDSLARAWSRPRAAVRSALRGWAMHGWSGDPFSRGAYSFTRAGNDQAAEKLRAPIGATLFFAGEATADGEEVGTVHGAVSSGWRAANEVVQVWRRQRPRQAAHRRATKTAATRHRRVE
jgi:monoamine oxidase